MAIKVAPWAVNAIETLIRGFLWCGTKVASGGKCAVAWVNACCPKELGGLGIPNLHWMGMALRMRWMCLACTDPSKTWLGFKFPYGIEVDSFFQPSVSTVVGDGRSALFWSDRWIDGVSIWSLAPNLWAAVTPRVMNSRTVRDGLLDR